MSSGPAKRRARFDGEKMRRLRILVPEKDYEQLRSFAPDYGAGAIVTQMIQVEARRRARAADRVQTEAAAS